MNLTSKKIDVYKLIIPLYLLLEARFFYLFSAGKLENFITYKVKVFIAAFAIFTFLISLTLKRKIKFDKISIWCIVFLIYVFFEVARNVSSYNLTFYKAFLASHGFFLILLFPALTIYSDKEKLYQYIIRIITIFSIILSIIFILQAVAFNFKHIKFLEIIEYKSWTILDIRKFGIRLTTPGTIIIFSTLISFGQIVGGNKDKIHFINLFLGLVYIVFVCQTRMTTIMIFLAMFLIVFFKMNKNRFKKTKICMVLLIGICVLILPYYIDEIFKNEEGGSVVARVYAVEIYGKSIMKRPVFGIGLLPDDKSDFTINNIMRGKKGYAHITDVGYIGYVFLFGIGGIVLLVILVKILYDIIKKCKTKDAAYYSLISCLLYIILTSATLSIFDTQRIVFLPFILYIAYYIQWKNRDMNNERKLINDKDN